MGRLGRLDNFRRLFAHARERLGLDIGCVLWDGSTVPADLPADALAIVVADEGAVAALLRRPNLDTFANLWVSARIDLRNGTLFDLVQKQPKVRTRKLFQSLDKRLLVKAALRFLPVSRGGPWPLEGIPMVAAGDGSAPKNQENIKYHYDISNAFYTLFLDPEMVYSCGYFTHWNNDLAAAQRDKLELICRKLRLQPGESLLDIGCGWGALCCYAAQRYGVRAHGLTLSEQQYGYVREKVARLGLADKITLEFKDYTAIEGQFDKIAQIEMFEHVGIANHPNFFRTIHRALKPGGLYLHQATTRPAKRDDARFRKRAREYAAITRYIFPGGELDHIGMSVANLERYGFEVHDVEGLRQHFARVCRDWYDRLLANAEAAEREVGRVKTRLWLVFLAGTSVAFERGNLMCYQTLASKRTRGPASLPPTRADLYR